MSQHPLEMILARQLAERLALPVVLIAADGTLAFYNEPAEEFLGVRFEEFGELPYADWSVRVRPVDEVGRPLDEHDRPIPTAIREQRPSHARFHLAAQDRIREVDITAIPLVSQSGTTAGTFAIFWEAST